MQQSTQQVFDWQNLQQNCSASSGRDLAYRARWNSPLYDFVKCNVDASIFQEHQ